MTDILTQFANLGAAGIIGMMWIAERKSSNKKDAQLSQSHNLILQKQDHIRCLTNVIKDNTTAITRLNETQKHQTSLLEQLLRKAS